MKRERPDEVLRGQMYYANLDPVIGSEQGGTRPVLVIQNNVGNCFSPTIIIAPITTRVKKLRQPTHIGIPPFFGLPQSSMAMLEQIRTIDKSRLGDYVGCLDDDVWTILTRPLVSALACKTPAKQHKSEPPMNRMMMCLMKWC